MTIQDRATRLWRRGQHGWPARYPVAQFPNVALLVYLVAVVVRHVTAGSHGAIDAVATVALIVWATDEIVRGSNAFRRGLGAVVLVATVVGLVTSA